MVLERALALGAFSGSRPQAFRILTARIRELAPQAGIALLQLSDARQSVAVVAYIDAYGEEHIKPSGEARLAEHSDALAQLAFVPEPAHVELSGELITSGLARELNLPHSVTMLAMPLAGRVEHSVWLLWPSEPGYLELPELWREVAFAYTLLGDALITGELRQNLARQQREISDLAELQRLLQPERRVIRGLDYAVHWQPANTAAGDYYDVVTLNQRVADFDPSRGDFWAVTVADVSGHGVAAAMEAVQLDAILRTYRGDEPPGGPAGAVTYANRYFFSRRQRPHFLTAFVCSFRPDLGRLEYVCAGHVPALLKRESGAIEWLGSAADGDIPLGVLREHRYTSNVCALLPGDLLVLYTDGVSEARNAAGEMFSHAILEPTLAGAQTAQHALDQIVAALTAHQNGTQGADDQTILVLAQREPTVQ